MSDRESLLSVQPVTESEPLCCPKCLRYVTMIDTCGEDTCPLVPDFGWRSRLVRYLRGDYFWSHDRRAEYHFARLVCAIFGHTPNTRDGGDCRRCWA